MKENTDSPPTSNTEPQVTRRWCLIKTLTGKTIEINFKDENTVFELKELLHKVEDAIKPESCRLVYGGKQMQDDQLLSEFSIPNAGVVYCVLRLKACSGDWCSCNAFPLPGQTYAVVTANAAIEATGATSKRLQKEIKDLKAHELTKCNFVQILQQSALDVIYQIQGPENTVYAGGKYIIHMEFPPPYPFKCFKVRIVTPLFHPQVLKNSSIANVIPIKNDAWSPQFTSIRFFENLQKAFANKAEDYQFGKIDVTTFGAFQCYREDFPSATLVAKDMAQYYGRHEWTTNINYLCPRPLRQMIITILLVHATPVSPLSVLPKDVLLYIIQIIAEADEFLYFFDDLIWWDHLQHDITNHLKKIRFENLIN